MAVILRSARLLALEQASEVVVLRGGSNDRSDNEEECDPHND